MKSAGTTSTTVDLFKSNNMKSTMGTTVDLSRTNPKDKDKDKEKGKKTGASSLKKQSPYSAMSKSAPNGKSKTEAQGPIDWTHLGIKLKYRGEKQREDAWEIWKASIGNAKKMLEDFNEILPVVKVERHPLYTMYFRRVAEENYESNTRTKSRLLMKKFILDVQELWLTNLQHLREHQPNKMATIKDEDEEEAENYMRGTGLDKRRDVKDIAGMQHQVQSVSQKRAFAQAYHTTRMPPPKVKLDYKPTPTPKLPPPKPVVPIIESIVQTLSFFKVQDRGSHKTSQNRHNNSNNSYRYDFVDDAVVNSTDSVALHVDRLLPSNDFATYIAQDVLWRITLIHSVSLNKRVFLVPETMMAMYAAEIINTDMSLLQNNQNTHTNNSIVTVYENRSFLPLPYHSDLTQFASGTNQHHSSHDHVVEWEGNITIQVSQSLNSGNTSSSSSSSSSHSDNKLQAIRITVFVQTQPVEHIQQLYRQQQLPSTAEAATFMTNTGGNNNHGQNNVPSYQFMLQLSPLEVRLLLHRADLPLYDLSWWTQPQRLSDIWEPLVPLLRLEATKDNNYTNLYAANSNMSYARQPVGLVVLDPYHHRRYDNNNTNSSSNNSVSSTTNSKNKRGKKKTDEVAEEKASNSHLSATNKNRFAYSEDMLTLLQAASCLYEVLPYLRMVMDENNSSDNSSTTSDHNKKYHVPIVRLQNRQNTVNNNVIVAPKLVEIQSSVDIQYPYDTIGIDSLALNSNSQIANTASTTTNDGKNSHSNGKNSSNNSKNGSNNSKNSDTSSTLSGYYDWKSDAKVFHQTGRWEKLLEQGVNGSLVASQGLDRIYYVPGASERGRRGLWFPDALDDKQEKTQVGAVFFRDAMKSTTDSILVHLTLFLETSVLFKSETAWENFAQLPVAAIGEEIQGTAIPMITHPPHVLLTKEHLHSPLQERLSACVTIFSNAAVEGIDYLTQHHYEHVLPAPQRPHGFRRYVPTKNQYGYREQIEVSLLNIDPVVDAKTFGITQQGAIPNTPGVNARNIWHNMVAVNEHICRPRTSRDYHYVVTNLNHCGANLPTSYTTRMKAMEMVGLTSSAFKHFEDAYAKIAELRNVFTKQLALESKIEKVTNDLKIKEAMTVRMYQRKLQRQLERKLKKSTKSEEGWKRRFKASSLVEVQGNWERRRDDRNNLLFFHRIQPNYNTFNNNNTSSSSTNFFNKNSNQMVAEENYAETCQWDIPTEWDGEFWKIHNPDYSGGIPQFQGSSADGLLSKHDTIDSKYPFHTGDTVMINGKAHHNPVRTIPQHLQNITVEHAGQLQTAMLQKQDEEHQGFVEPRSDWHPAAAAAAAAAAANNNHNNSFLSSGTRPPVPPLHGLQATDGHDGDNMSELNSARADRSIADSLAPTIDTVNLEHIAEQLISSDEIMRVIAKRLGIPESQVIPADELSSVFTTASGGPGHSQAGSSVGDSQSLKRGGGGGIYAPRDPIDYDVPLHQKKKDKAGAIDYDSDEDLWSDEDEEVGDFDVQKEISPDAEMPQNQLEMAQWKRRHNLEAMMSNDLHHGTHSSGIQKKKNNHADLASVPSQVPYLDLREVLGGQETNATVEANSRRYNWRRLPRPVVKDHFFSKALETHVRGPDPTSCNTLNTPIFLMPIAPVDACHYVPEPFAIGIESIFIPNAKKDMERSIATLDRNIKREEEMARNMPTDDLLLFGEAKEFTSVEMFLAKQYKADQAQVSDPMDAAKERALLAAKATNIAQMEDCLAEDIPINTADQFGNTLLILGAQQGSRRMCKFLLRRGANINAQNLSGNTALHYCYAYGNKTLGEYLKSKGANDAIVNVDGLTCYEGLSKDAMAEFYGDFEENDYENAGQSVDGDGDDQGTGGLQEDSFMDVSQLGNSTIGY